MLGGAQRAEQSVDRGNRAKIRGRDLRSWLLPHSRLSLSRPASLRGLAMVNPWVFERSAGSWLRA